MERYKKAVRDSDPDGKPGLCKTETVNVEEMEKWSAEIIKYIQDTMYEMRPLEK